MNQPFSLQSPRIELHGTAPGARTVRPLLCGLASFLVLMIGAAFAEPRPGMPVVAVLLATALWLAGPAYSLIAPLLIKVFPPKPGQLDVGSGGLVVRRGKTQLTYPAHDIAEARLQPLAGQLELRFTNGKGVQIEIPHLQHPTALLDAVSVPSQKRVYVARLGLDPAKSLTPWLLAGFVSVVATAAFLLSASSAAMALWILPFVASIVFWIARSFEERGELAVTREGVTLQRPGSRQFLHHGGLRDVRVDPDRLRLFTDNGREISSRIDGIDSAGRQAIESWVQMGRQQFAGASAGTDAFAALDRHGRSIDAWREALRTILHQEGLYRRAPITADDLAQLLTNPHAPAERRIAAAFVLSQNQTVTTHKQIRFAAESSSSQPMRIALRGLADERIELAAIEEALAAETGSLAR